MKLLILGGTRFLGRHAAATALDRGHEVTVFHTGRSGRGLFPTAMHVFGDRARDLSGLEGRTWDAVIDTCGYLPDVVRRSATLLSDVVGHMVFVSTISVYSDLSAPGADESAPRSDITEAQSAALDGMDPSAPWTSPAFPELYGPLKSACEDEILRVFPERCAVVRPGLIVGPEDYTHRFSYWVRLVADGGEVLAPGRPERAVQFIDSRDLGAWLVRLAEERIPGTFNATGPATTLTMKDMLDAMRTALSSHATFEWIDDAFLVEHQVQPWSELPLWLPETPQTTHAGMLQVDVRRAISAGLDFRALEDTALDTWRSIQDIAAGPAGAMTRERERQLLELWKVKSLS